MNVENTLEGEQEVKCSFCDEKYPSLAIGDHLLLCGNKTEQCPNCEKYIRRAVFAYHYENKCEDFLESMRQPSSNPKKPILNSQKSELQTMTCKFCNEECETHDRIIHEANCLKNPDNIKKRKPQSDNETETIPCEVCNQAIPMYNYKNHAELCLEQAHQLQMQNQPQSSDKPFGSSKNVCQYCGAKHSKFVLKFHEGTCDCNPKPWPLVKILKPDIVQPTVTRNQGPNE